MCHWRPGSCLGAPWPCSDPCLSAHSIQRPSCHFGGEYFLRSMRPRIMAVLMSIQPWLLQRCSFAIGWDPADSVTGEMCSERTAGCQRGDSWHCTSHSPGWHPEVHGSRALGQDSRSTGLGHSPPESRCLLSGSAPVGDPEPLFRFEAW